ncbi:MAG: hypothetical protein LRY36_01540 [Alphaproteobacteria bacterium]|nr:hypothetical protein [Alphaproteobacteria bacterium]
MRISLWIFLVLVGGAIAFELHPAVQQGRSLIPDQVYTNPECGCLCLIESRPWYSTFNYWFWLWVVAVPVLAFGINKDWSLRRKLLVAGLITLFCYGALNLSVGLMWDIRNAPFIVSSEPDIEWQKAWDMKCATIADGAAPYSPCCWAGYLQRCIQASGWALPIPTGALSPKPVNLWVVSRLSFPPLL